jgi:hypothetical protein
MVHDMPELNDGIRRLQWAVASQPLIDDVAQIGILTFSDSAQVVLPLGQMSWNEVPVLAARGAAAYGAAFHLLAKTIKKDVAKLKGQRCQVYRPCVFFLSAGQPSDADWERTFRRALTYDSATGKGLKTYPVVVPFGFRDAPDRVLRKLAYPRGRAKWYHSRNSSIETALQGILHLIMNSVMGSGNMKSEPDSGFTFGGADEWI